VQKAYKDQRLGLLVDNAKKERREKCEHRLKILIQKQVGKGKHKRYYKITVSTHQVASEEELFSKSRKTHRKERINAYARE
jgi:hypothetical protein